MGAAFSWSAFATAHLVSQQNRLNPYWAIEWPGSWHPKYAQFQNGVNATFNLNGVYGAGMYTDADFGRCAQNLDDFRGWKIMGIKGIFGTVRTKYMAVTGDQANSWLDDNDLTVYLTTEGRDSLNWHGQISGMFSPKPGAIYETVDFPKGCHIDFLYRDGEYLFKDAGYYLGTGNNKKFLPNYAGGLVVDYSVERPQTTYGVPLMPLKKAVLTADQVDDFNTLVANPKHWRPGLKVYVWPHRKPLVTSRRLEESTQDPLFAIGEATGLDLTGLDLTSLDLADLDLTDVDLTGLDPSSILQTMAGAQNLNADSQDQDGDRRLTGDDFQSVDNPFETPRPVLAEEQASGLRGESPLDNLEEGI